MNFLKTDFQPGTCPTCAGPLAGSSATGTLCLRCAGVRVLDPESGEEVRLPGCGQRIGPYEIVEELGHGGMGRVYAAYQLGLGRIVALKAIPAGLMASPDLELRFLREAQTIARLNHPNIVAVHDSGRADGCLYFSMEYIEGGDLAARLRVAPFGIQEAARLMEQIASALAYAHGQGVLHRDLKPSNILLDGEQPKLADFGLAAELEAGGDLTRLTSVLGTPHYLAPEAISGGSAALGVASDLYALGVILFQLLAGRTPFAGASAAELPALVATAEPPSPRLLAPAVPRDLETICLKCLERDAAKRYGSAAALAEDLRRFRAGEPIVARPVSGMGRFTRWCRRRPALAAIWLLLLALALGSTAAAAWIARERALALAALGEAHGAALQARERTRDAKLAEARAIRRTDLPGRRDQALAALAEAARIRAGPDLRDEAIAALLLPDVRPDASWATAGDLNGQVTVDPSGTVAAWEVRNSMGTQREPAELRRWGSARVIQRLVVAGTRVIGPLRFSRDGRLVMARFLDRTLRVWRIGETGPCLTIARPLPAPATLTDVANDDYDFGPDGTWFALGLGGAGGLTVNRVSDGIELARWSGDEIFNALRCSPDGRHLAALSLAPRPGRPGIYLFDLPAGTLAETLDSATPASAIAWAGDSRVLAAALVDDTVALYDRHGGRLLEKLPAPGTGIWSIGLVGRSEFVLARGNDFAAHLESLAPGARNLDFGAVRRSLVGADPAADTFVLASIDAGLARWRALPPAGWRVLPPPRLGGYRYSAAGGDLDFSPDGRWIATAHVRYIAVRDAATGRLGAELDSGIAAGDDFRSAAFAPDGRALLGCSTLGGLWRYPLADDGDGGLKVGTPEALDREPGFGLMAQSADRRRLLLLNMETGGVKVDDLVAGGVKTVSRWIVPGVWYGVFSPDAQTILINCSGRGPEAAAQRLRLYRASDGTVVRELSAKVSNFVAWSGNGRTALTSNGADRSIVWDPAEWRPRLTLTGPIAGDPTIFALSHDGAFAVIQEGRNIHLVSMTDGAIWATIQAPEAAGDAENVRFSPDGRRVAVLWPDGRVDMIEPDALHAALGKIGLAW